MESTGQERRRSARIGNNTLIQQAITEENRLYLKSPYLLKKEAGGTLQVFSTELIKDQFWLGSGSRLYKWTRSGYLVFDRGAHGGEEPEEEDPEPEPRAISLYKHLGVIYRRTQTGEVAVEEDIHIVTWDNRWLAEEIGLPIHWENHRRHHIARSEEEESESEGSDPRRFNVRIFDGYQDYQGELEDSSDIGEEGSEEEENSEKEEEADGEEGEEEEREEGYEESEENEEDCEEEEEDKENKENN